MSTTTIFTFAGLALVVSAVTGALGPAIHPPDHSLGSIPTWNWGAAHGLLALTWALRLVAIPALYARVASRTGIIGLVSFVLLLFYCGNTLVNYLFEVNVLPALAAYPVTRPLFEVRGPPPVNFSMLGTLSMPLSLAGQLSAIVFGVLVMRAWPAARGAGLMLGLGTVAAFAAFPIAGQLGGSIIPVQIGFAILSIGYGWLGLKLWHDQTQPISVARPVPQAV